MQKKYFFLVLAAASIIFCASQTAEAAAFRGRTLQLPLQKIAPGPGEILIDFTLPANHVFAKDAPSTLRIRSENDAVFKVDSNVRPLAVDRSILPYSIAYQAGAGNTVAIIDMKIHFCDEVTKICLVDSVSAQFPVAAAENSPSKVNLSIPLKGR